jgi:crotonobetainyl-CoA:carnitine CoA-transferase CaiB-like acyl-CoA transferase
VAVAVEDEAQWAAFVEWLGDPDWASTLGARLPTDDGDVHEELDRHLSEVFAGRNLEDAVASLAKAGVPAEAVVLPGDIEENPQHQARSFFEELAHPVAGTQQYPGLPFRMASGPDHWFDTPPPLIGEHNDIVLGEELGLSDEERTRLSDLSIIGTRPLGL